MQTERVLRPTPRRPSLISLAGAVALTGCAAGTSEEAVLEDLPEWTLEETLRIGDLDDPDLGFSRITSIRIAADGSIFVLEGQEREIRVFDPQGRPQMILGGQGDGPGEFQFPSGMGILGDTLWVRDLMAQRTTLFSLDGELMATVPSISVSYEIGDPPVRMMASTASPRADGTFEATYSYFLDPEAVPNDRTVRVPRLRLSADGEIMDTVGWYGFSVRASLLMRVGDRVMFTGQPFSDAPLNVGRDGDRWVIERSVARSADDATLTIMATGEDEADTLLVRNFPYRPIAIDAPFADSVRESSIEEFVDDGFPEPEARRQIQRRLTIPDFLTPVTRGLLGEDGSLWLRREEDQTDEWRWNVFDPHGEPTGFVRTPRSFDIQVADDDEVWGVHTDDLGVPWVVGYRLVRD